MRQSHRRGMTLLELVLVISTVAMLATMSARLLHAIIRQQSAATAQLALHNSLLRIEELLRDDAHHAIDVEVYLNSMLQLTRADGRRVEWSRKDDWLIRREEGKGKKVEHFDLLPELALNFETITLDDPPTLPEFIVFELVRETAGESGQSTPRDPRFTTVRGGAKVMVAVGRDLRFRSGEKP